MTQIPQKVIHRFAPIATPENTEVDFASLFPLRLALRRCNLRVSCVP